MHFVSTLIVALLFLTVRINGQCNNTAGCFPDIGNIALYRNVTATSTCGENGTTEFTVFGDDGSGSLMECSADSPSLAYPASNINDNNLDTSWQSDTNVTDVIVQLDLEGPMLLESLRIVWTTVTPSPSAMIIERSSDFGVRWMPYRYFATNCVFFVLNNTSYTPDTVFNSTEAVCTTMESQLAPFIFNNRLAEITFNTSSHFYPGITDDEILEYQTITNLRLNLLRAHTELSSETESYYAISEWFVYGTCLCNGHADQCTPVPGETRSYGKIYAGCDCQHRTAGNNCEMCEPLYNNAEYMRGTIDNASVCEMCQCFGHADECFYDPTINGGQCICNNNTEGEMCHNCVAGFYRDPAMLYTEACIDCGCFLLGVSDPICNSSTGACFCKANVDPNVNAYCDTCLDGYWNISSANPDGCQECSCNLAGSTCDKTSGNCTCQDGFFMLGGVCTACDCNPVGAVNASCTLPDGRCYCRENITNTRCNAPGNGFYARPLDFFIFEAEDANYPDGANQIFPAISNPTNFTGLGFLELTTTLTEITFQFSVSRSYQYDLIIRYSTINDGFSVSGVIESLSSVTTTLQCSNTSTSGITRDESIFGILDITPTHGAEVVHTMCLEAGVMYEATFTFFSFGSLMTRLLDSIVLMPTYITGSNYLNSPEVLPVHAETAQLCIPIVAGEVNPACDLDLVFILSLEFFGQVYSCDCNPVGTEVTTDCSISSGTCVCKQGIGGMLCDRCIPSYFNFTANGCTACNCFTPGVVDFSTCDPVNGTCVCKPNVDDGVNRICDTCRDGYWNISSDNPDGCQACQCNSNGSSNLTCDKTFGNCLCYENYIGQTCSECADGYYLSSGQCVFCNCNPIGSNQSICDKTSGQCSCMPNIEGRRCNRPQSGFFFRPLDYLRFEAESLSYSEEFMEVFPITSNPVYENPFTGRGFIAFPGTTAELSFILTVPKSSQYEIILRYMLPVSESIIISMNITSLTPTVNSLDCSEVNDTVNAYETLTLTNQNSFHIFRSVCLDEGTEYEVVVSHRVFFRVFSTTFEVDSIVLIPDFAVVSDFYNSSTIQESQLQSCIPRAAGSVPPGSSALCDEVAFSLSIESFGQPSECDCDVTGTTTSNIQECIEGYCSCKDGVGGERCDQCLNGYYNFSTNGCTACDCDVNNSISLLCDDGECLCALGITGSQCNECDDGWYNFTSSGCQPCNCERLGSESNVCDKLTGICDCIDGAIGDLCDACPDGTILTNTRYQRFCEPCRCYDRSDNCTVDTNTYNLVAITSNFIELCNNSFTIIDDGWTLEGSGTFTRCSTNGLGYNSSITDMDRFVAPANFTGDLTGSYSLQFSVQLQLSQMADLQLDMSTVEICGPEEIECLVGQLEVDSSRLQSDRIILLSIPFRETYWQFTNTSNNTPTYLEFLYTLTDVTSFSFTASHAMIETYYLQSISLQTIISANSIVDSDVVVIESMFPVEYCQQCFINYTGRFCENCAEGYYRPSGGLDCIACDCNDLSQSCDPLTGTCTECRGNSTGSNCESCMTGFYGDPGRNISCRPCECAGMTDPTCELDVDGNQTCTTCPLGRDGRNCEICADDYFVVAPGVCFRCECFGNAIPSDDGSICDMENGFCFNCSFNTTGVQCEQCLPGYFGDPTQQLNCSECTCHVNGTDGLCNNTRGVGVCTCKPGTTGIDCDRCLPGYWGLHLGGCRPCECCSNGSINASCDQTTGECLCLPGVGSEEDTRCCECSLGSYSLEPGSGCQTCNCFTSGVVDFTTCDPVNGSCVCKANVDDRVNRICNTCRDGYWNISSDNPDGCQACQCNSNGSSDLTCDKTFGNCSCYENYIGQTCSECADGYYLSNSQCVSCNCNPVGSDQSICDETSGQCSCITNAAGRRCNRPQSGFFFRPLDYLRFEAESLSYSEEFMEVFPIASNPVYENPFTGRGFIAFPGTTAELSFILTVLKSSQYEIILRYMLPVSESIIISMNITSLTPTVNSLDCSEVNDTVNAYETLTLTNQNSFHIFRSVCLDEGTEYEVVVSRFVFFRVFSTAFEVDSIVLIPDFAVVSDFYNSSTIQESQLQSCIPRAAGSVPPGSSALCDEVAFSLSIESFGQPSECDCDVTGTTTSNIQECIEGYCSCKDGVGGERCDQCLNGYYNFSTNGCTACDCDVNNSISLLCDDGECSCALGITGSQCSECDDGWYNFTSSGCQPCNCEPLGSESNVCDKLIGTCDCIDGAIGDLCDSCPDGTILTNTRYQRFCEPCRCYDRSDNCIVDTNTYNLVAITSNFIELCNNSFTIIDDGWALEGSGTFTRCSTNGLGYNSSITDMDRFVAPANFTGDLTGSYSLQFSVQLQLSQIADLQLDMSTVEICGPEEIECLVGQFEVDSSRLQTDGIILLSIPFRETYWQFTNTSNSTPNYLEFLYTLTDVTSFSFAASHAMIKTYYLQNISLQAIISANSIVDSDVIIVESMFPVEYCQQCFMNYTGRFCENCAEGYYRPPGGLDCIACDCNDLSQSCDPLTGTCTECRGNSTGSNCESCITGFYGDPGRNISCRPCECAGMTDPTCELDVDGNQTCTTCPLGRDGRNCEVCADDYFAVAPGVCFRCDCFGNAIPSDDGSICDMENGFCINCSFNTAGVQCERCLPGYFGDPTGQSNCSECTCHVNGTEGLCSNIRGVGVCTCKPGTTGIDCDQCLPGYWGLHLGGCRPCECCINGSINASCDQTTGACFCLSGVGSEEDTRCCECSLGSYSLEPGAGCQDCGCSEAVISPQCNESGACMCTGGAVGEKCDECGFEYSGEIPNCQRCSECFDNGLEHINELAANITSLTMKLYQLISARAPLDNISDIISELDYQLARAESAVQNNMIISSDVTLLEDKANDTKTVLDMLRQNFTMVSDLLISINSSVTNDLEVIAMFNGSVYGNTITDVLNTLENISMTVSDLNISSHDSFQTLQQRLVEAESLQNDFDNAVSNITESLVRINETTRLLSVAENLINSTTTQYLDNRDSLSFLSADIPVLQNDIQAQLSRVQSYESQLNSTYFRAMALWDTLTESKQDILNSSILIEQVYNYSNISLDLTTNAVTALQDLNDDVSSLANKTQELLDNVTMQLDIIFNATGIVDMANSTTWATLAIRTPNVELAQMLATEINSTFLPAAEVATIATAIANSSVVAQQTLQIAQNASVLVDQISTLVNDTIEKIDASVLLSDNVNTTLQQLLAQQRDIENYASQVNDNLIFLNNSAETIDYLTEIIDMAVTDAYAIGIDNYNRSTVLRTNANELCALANSIEQQSFELNGSLVNISSEVDTAEEYAAAQFATVQALHENATELNATAAQQLQDLLNEYLADKNRITQLTTTANSLSNELDQLIADIEETSVTLRDCIRTP